MLSAKAGLAPDHLEQLCTFGTPKRDPRGGVVSVAYLAVVRALPSPIGGTCATSVDGIDAPIACAAAH